MAHPSTLAKAGSIELTEAVRIIHELLPEDEYPDQHANLVAAQRDVVGRSDPGFLLAVLAGSMTRIIQNQDARIRELEGARSPDTRQEKRGKGSK